MFDCLFSFKGASGRLHFLGNGFFWFLCFLCSFCFFIIMMGHSYFGIAGIILISILAFFSMWACAMRRMHDLGVNGFWATPYILLTFIPGVAFNIYDAIHGNSIMRELKLNNGLLVSDEALIAAGFLLVSAILSLVFFVALAVLPGRETDNPYL